MNIIELVNVSKIYKLDNVEVKAISNINLKIKNGETVAIMGPSGSGKSTLLHIIGCLDKPSSGKVIIDSKDVSKLNENQLAEIRRQKIGFVFQFFYLIPSLNALRNVMFPMLFTNNLNKEEKEKKAIELLELVGLKNRIYHRPAEMSGGERQRIAIARALANDPQIILADEPTGNLDTEKGKAIIDLLLNLNKEKNITLIIVTHDSYIASHAKRIIKLKDGKIISDSKK
ncbi:MAG: ABC transporter ATP-binding protein [Candidatus Aenigmarchaeota archaeon]|nr:ABC transporter ATP-binding protein [Candidatus Aenigmarchaeota archaeon]